MRKLGIALCVVLLALLWGSVAQNRARPLGETAWFNTGEVPEVAETLPLPVEFEPAGGGAVGGFAPGASAASGTRSGTWSAGAAVFLSGGSRVEDVFPQILGGNFGPPALILARVMVPAPASAGRDSSRIGWLGYGSGLAMIGLGAGVLHSSGPTFASGGRLPGVPGPAATPPIGRPGVVGGPGPIGQGHGGHPPIGRGGEGVQDPGVPGEGAEQIPGSGAGGDAPNPPAIAGEDAPNPPASADGGASTPDAAPGEDAGNDGSGEDAGGNTGENENGAGTEPATVPAEAAGATVTPEPVSMVLLGTGLVGLAATRRRRRRV